ncbi:MFS transporter, partial [Micromonospora sp. WMMD736]|uniref:MFS transporter n=1 Tax=Micromonospora sp. WMMD736 TaxID=3404112 RepID=UPI003B967742
MTRAARPASPATSLLSNRSFGLMVCGQFLSYFAVWTSNIVLLHTVYDRTGSALGPGLLLVTQFLPAFFLMPVISSILDRFDRRHVIVAVNVCNGGLALVLLVWSSTLPVGWFFAIYLLYSASITTFIVANMALLPQVVEPVHLTRANVFLMAIPSLMLVCSGAIFIGQPLGNLHQPGEMLLVAVLFCASAIVFGRIGRLRTGSDRTRQHSCQGLLGDFLTGLGYLVRDRPLAWVFVIRMAIYLGVGAQVLLALYSEEVFGLGEAGIGLLYLARGVGLLIGGAGLAQLLLTKGLPSVHAIGVGLALFGFGYLAASAVPGFGIAAVAMALGVGFLGEGLLKPVTTALLQQRADPEYLARVMAAEQGLSAVVQ